MFLARVPCVRRGRSGCPPGPPRAPSTASSWPTSLDPAATPAADPGLAHCTIAGFGSGAGRAVEAALPSSPLASPVDQASAHLATGRDPGPMGDRHPSG
ncbi:hypothetical protein [Streptomyces sp. cg2]|uniref:hypothetical protein n=1 Tax=Streptomyces sp. cg2 TaxID=3238799 RepID=UPI0034E1E6D1